MLPTNQQRANAKHKATFLPLVLPVSTCLFSIDFFLLFLAAIAIIIVSK